MTPTKEQQERLNELLEFAYDVDDASCHHVGGLDDLTPLWKLYIRNRIALGVRMQVDMLGQPTPHYWLAEFEAFPTGDKVHGCPINNLVEGGFASEPTPRSHEYGVNGAVFVSVGEVLEDDEGVLTPVPSIVRLKPLNHCPMPRGDLTQATGLSKVSALDSGNTFVSDRELDFLDVSGHLAPRVVEGKLPNKVVEGTPQVVNEVSDDEPRSAQERLEHFYNIEDMLACIRVDLGANSYRVSFSPNDRFHFRLQGIVVLDCPVDFGPDITEVGLVGHD
jgi:hypothetical protein